MTTAPDQRLARFGVDDAFQMGRINGVGLGLIELRLSQSHRQVLATVRKLGTGEVSTCEVHTGEVCT